MHTATGYVYRLNMYSSTNECDVFVFVALLSSGNRLLPTSQLEMDKWGQDNNLDVSTVQALKDQRITGRRLFQLTEKTIGKLNLPLGEQMELLDAIAALKGTLAHV